LEQKFAYLSKNNDFTLFSLDDFVKQQLSSLRYVCEIIRRRIGRLADKSNDSSTDEDDDEQLCDLPIRVVLTQNTALSFFIDFLQLVGGQNYIDCYLAIEVCYQILLK
jgi:hypothetical protein